MSYFTLNEIYFKVNFREYQISLDSPLKATTSYELRMKARKIVESIIRKSKCSRVSKRKVHFTKRSV